MRQITKEEIRKVREYLIVHARILKRHIFYQELSDDCRLKLYMGNQHHKKIISDLLTALSLYEIKNDRPIISSLVVREDDKMPGEGYDKVGKISEYKEDQKSCYRHWKDNSNFYEHIALTDEQIDGILELYKHV